jgi:hypothetical protein
VQISCNIVSINIIRTLQKKLTPESKRIYNLFQGDENDATQVGEINFKKEDNEENEEYDDDATQVGEINFKKEEDVEYDDDETQISQGSK